jgi:NAD(P)-dependent dehydrogenase (short-subunit alcohol dehydrogenase family)
MMRRSVSIIHVPRRFLGSSYSRLNVANFSSSFSSFPTQPTSKTKKGALIVGAGEGIGQALCRRFKLEGYVTGAARRSPGGLDFLKENGTLDVAFDGFDARKEVHVNKMFEEFESHCDGNIEVVVFNIGANIKFPILETTKRKFEKCWEMACLSGFLVGREAARSMTKTARGDPSGTIIFTGATASMRGASGFSAFSVAKGGLRQLSQSMARELGPKGVHVAHVVIDGAVDSPFIRENFKELLAKVPSHAIVNPDEVADAYLFLHNQTRRGRSCWTHEMDLRPSIEKW